MADYEKQYQFNGSAAYEYAPQPEKRQEGLPEDVFVPRKQPRQKAKFAVAPFTVVGLGVVICMLVLVIFGYVQIYEAQSDVSKLENRCAKLESELSVLVTKYENKLDLNQIQSRAEELGLSAITADQTVYLDLSGSDCAEIYHETRTGIGRELVAAVRHSVSELIAYLHPTAA